MTTAIRIESVSKFYRLGTGTMAHHLNRWWHTIRAIRGRGQAILKKEY
jgi:hypothetical protein